MSQVPSLLSIPPERVGANGEYDYYGLAKRVQAGLRKGFGCDVANHLYIQQRGSAILLSGNVSSRALAEAITQFILSLDGATQVELRQLQVLGTQRLAAALSV
jgi:hypothetical protein